MIKRSMRADRWDAGVRVLKNAETTLHTAGICSCSPFTLLVVVDCRLGARSNQRGGRVISMVTSDTDVVMLFELMPLCVSTVMSGAVYAGMFSFFFF